MRYLGLLVILLLISAPSLAKEFCGYLNAVKISETAHSNGITNSKKRAYVKLYNKDFLKDFITIDNYALAENIVNRLEQEIKYRNDDIVSFGHPELDDLKIRRKGNSKISYGNWYWKSSVLKYYLCINLHHNVVNYAKKVYAISKPSEFDFPLIDNFKASINTVVYTKPSALEIYKRGDNIMSENSYEDPWLYAEGADEYCFKGKAKDLANYLNQNDGEPFWYYDEGEFFVKAKVMSSSVVEIKLRNDYENYNTSAELHVCK